MPFFKATPQAKSVGQSSIEIVHEIGKEFVAVWRFKNTGSTAWPNDTILLKSNGDVIDFIPWYNLKTVGANEETDVILQGTAPCKPGKYFACFRLCHGDNTQFGDKVYLNLTVKDTSVK